MWYLLAGINYIVPLSFVVAWRSLLSAIIGRCSKSTKIVDYYFCIFFD